MHITLIKRESEGYLKCIESSREKGLDGLCFVFEEDYFHPYKEIVDFGERNGVKIFVGVLIKTKKGRLICIPADVNDEFFKKSWLKTEERVPSENELCDCLHKTGGIVVAPHPYNRWDKDSFGDYIFNLGQIDGIIVTHSKLGRVQNNLAFESASILKTLTLGGSGVVSDYFNVGRTATLFLYNIPSQKDIIFAIKRGDAWPVEIFNPKMGMERNDK